MEVENTRRFYENERNEDDEISARRFQRKRSEKRETVPSFELLRLIIYRAQ